MDERAGRAMAEEHGLRVAGTAAVIGMAKSRGLTVSAKDVFSKLHASDFRISAAVIQPFSSAWASDNWGGVPTQLQHIAFCAKAAVNRLVLLFK